MQRENDPTNLGSVILSMVESRRFEGVEAGFISLIAAQLLRSPSLIEPILS
jgi:hypothetical protein